MSEIEIENSVTTAEEHAAIDRLEQHNVANGINFVPPLEHTFTNGLYVRKIFMPAGSLITSRIHMTQHQWICLSGKSEVFVGGEWIIVQAGDMGITQPGTRRVLKILEDTQWVTIHPNPDNLTVQQIEDTIIFKHDKHLEGIPQRRLE